MIVTIIGARPQFVKAAVVSKAFIDNGLEEVIIHTGQHYDDAMSNVFWKELGIPRCEINLKAGSGNQGKQTAFMLEKIEDYLLSMRPKVRLVLVYGDTNSTIAGSLAAAKLGIPIVHVEAGLRSFNRSMPEEINRVVTDHLSEVLFCSSEDGVLQLAKEGILKDVYDVGDVMHDALNLFRQPANDKIKIEDIVPFNIGQRFLLLTLHRPSNTDNKNQLKLLIDSIANLGLPVVWPVHPRNIDIDKNFQLPENLFTVKPFSYFEMIKAMENCFKILTDSGGVQKEAYWMKKPCITLRKETEWVETLENSWNQLALSKDEIEKAFNINPGLATWKPLYTKGIYSSVRIAQVVKEKYY